MLFTNNAFKTFLSVFYWEFKKDFKQQILYIFISGIILFSILSYTYYNIEVSLFKNFNDFLINQVPIIWIITFLLIYLTIDSILFQKFYIKFLNVYFTSNYLWIFFAKICAYTVKILIWAGLLFCVHYIIYINLLGTILINTNEHFIKMFETNINYIRIYYILHYIFLSYCIILITFINFLFNILFINNIYKNKLLIILQVPTILSITITNIVFYINNFPTIEILSDPLLLSNFNYYLDNKYIIFIFLFLSFLAILVYFSILNKIFIRIIKK